MPANRTSLQDRIRQRQSSEFVGREDQLALFRRNFALPLDERIYVFNVFGQGGVGKTTLLRRFRETTVASGALPALTDHDQTDVLTAMEQLAADLARQGHELRAFAERYRVYRQRRQELESEPDAPTGLSSLFARTLVKGGLALARGIPVGGGLVDLVDGDAAASKTGEWVEYVARKLRNNTDEIRLVREPVEELTRVWLDDLNKIAEKSSVVLFFDTYERTAPFLDEWLCDVLGGAYGPLPETTQLVIAGRDELDRNRWSEYESVIARLSLEPFDEVEAREFLARKGVANEQVVDVILKLTGRLPLLVATLAAERPDDPTKVGDPSGTAVERFLLWTEDPILRRSAVDAALPRQFNRDLVALLVEDQQVDRVFEWLRRMPFVEERADGWAYHAVVRDQMLRYKRRESNQSWVKMHEKLAEHFQQQASQIGIGEREILTDKLWRAVESEALYHQLNASYNQTLPSALNNLLAILNTSRRNAAQWAKILQQVEEEINIAPSFGWGSKLHSALEAYDQRRYEEIIAPLTELLARGDLLPRRRAIVLVWRGSTYRMLMRFDDALADLSAALVLDSENMWAMRERGTIYKALKRYEEAIADLSRVIEQNPQSVFALEVRGDTYQLLGRYDEALVDLNRALELNPQEPWALAVRGAIHAHCNRFDVAMADLDCAVELDSQNARAFAERGRVHRRIQRPEAAILDFTRAISINPGIFWAWAERGETYRQTHHYNEALADFNTVIKHNSRLAWAIGQRATTLRQLQRYDEALADLALVLQLQPNNDWRLYEYGLLEKLHQNEIASKARLDRAIQLARQKFEEAPADWNNAFNLSLYLLASGEIGANRQHYRDIASAAPVLAIHGAIQDLDDYLVSFPDNAAAQSIRAELQAEIERRGAEGLPCQT